LKKELEAPHFIIVLGTTASGSGAIYDYLNGRSDIYSPLSKGEYQLPQIPNGLMSLEAASEQAFHTATSDYAIVQFENILEKLSRSYSILYPGKGFDSKLKLFSKSTEQFVKEISAASYPMHLDWHRLMRSPIQNIISLLKSRLGLNIQVPETRILTSRENLIIAAQKMHNRIFQPGSEGLPILLNQAGSGWNPIESTKYFVNRKIVLVTRDPRDQFTEIKKFKKGTSVSAFVQWYKEMQRRIKKISDPIFLNISFEDFINQNKKNISLLCDHVSISADLNSTYKVEFSKINVGKYKRFLNKNEIEIIEDELSEYL